MTDAQAGRRRILYGRRKGRPLSAAQEERMARFMPRLGIVLPRSGLLDLSSLFGSPRESYWLEIGFGGGEHLAHEAARHPEIGMIGAEPYVNGVARLVRHIETLGLANVRLYPDDARSLIDHLPDASIDRVFLLFPDPWPKTRHERRRFPGPETLDQLARVMRPRAAFRIATDERGYCRWALSRLGRHPDFEWTAEGPRDWRQGPEDAATATRYEEKARQARRRVVYLTFRRR